MFFFTPFPSVFLNDKTTGVMQALIAYLVVLPQHSCRILDENSACLCYNSSSLERDKGANMEVGRFTHLKVCRPQG